VTRPTRLRLAAGAAALALVAAAGLYGTARLLGNRADPACAASAAILPTLRPLARGEVAAFEPAERALPAPRLAFRDGEGAPRSLADLSGRTVLLNLWATWCEPCKREMPALDGLQAALGGPDFEVVAVNIDTRNLDRPRAWLEAAGIRNLAYYSDREAKVFQDLRRAGQAEGMPTTILVDRDGCRLGTLPGPAGWSAPEAVALVKAALGR